MGILTVVITVYILYRIFIYFFPEFSLSPPVSDKIKELEIKKEILNAKIVYLEKLTQLQKESDVSVSYLLTHLI